MKKEAFIYTWSIEDEEAEDRRDAAFHIRLYGIDEEQKNICVHARGFMPYFYIELAGVKEDEMRAAEKGITRNILWLLNAEHCKSECEEGGCRRCWKGRLTFVYGMKKLYFHHRRNSFGMIKMEFQNNVQRKRTFYKLQEKKIQVGYRSEKTLLLVHENEANPVLQFCTQQHVDTAGWVRWVKEADPPVGLPRQTSCHREISKASQTIRPLEDKERPPPEPHVLSFDIEVYSSVSSRMPDAEREEDVIFQVSMVSTRDHSQFRHYLLSLGAPVQSIVGKDVILRTYGSEKELLLGFVQVLHEENPNVVIGYNIFGFDLMYMVARAKMWGVLPLFDQMGMRVRDRLGRAVHSPEKTVNWTSSAYSHQNFMFLDAEGRLFVDLLPVVRRDYKFENYRLKTVSEFFIGQTKDPIKPRDIFEGYRLAHEENQQTLLSRVGKYCVQDSKLVLLLFEKLQLWIGLTEMAKTCRVPPLALYTQGQQVKVFSQLYYLCTHNRIVVQSPHSLGKDRHHIEGADHYSGAYVFPPDPGVYDWVVPFDFCLTGDTTVTLANGTSRRIDTMARDIIVLGHKDGGLRAYPSVHGLQVKGVRGTVEVLLQDGRRLTCTPDHKVMLADGSWCPAGELQGREVLCGPVGTEDRRCALEGSWLWQVGARAFRMHMPQERDATLAFARAIGYMWPSRGHADVASFGTRMDTQAFQMDLALVLGTPPVSADGLHVELPLLFLEMLNGLAVSDTGMPCAITDSNCPKSIVREFWGGWHGAAQLHKLHGHVDLLRLHDARLFLGRAGVRYNINASCMLSLMVSYQGYDVGALSMTASEYAAHVGASGWLEGRAMAADAGRVPCYRQRVISVRPHRAVEVFDIEVRDAHSFVASSIVVSNCSLYPSTIIAYNIDFSTLVTDSRVPDDDCHIIQWWDHIGCDHDTTVHATKPKTAVCQEFRYRFLKGPVGVIPQLLKDLLAARSSTRGQMKELKKRLQQMESDTGERRSLETLYKVYDKRQLAYKVSANSMYGAMGVKKGYLPFLPGAMCTTAMGRHSIQKAADHVKARYNGRIVYGDTDSIYCHFPLPAQSQYAETLWTHAKRIEEEIMGIFPKPMKLAFEEKIYKKFMILTKKRYMALTCDHRGVDDAKLTIRGVLLARRDNARWVRDLYERVVRSVMANMDFQALVELLNEEVLALFRDHRTLPMRQFIISKTLGKDYTIRELPADAVKQKKRLMDLSIDQAVPGWEEKYRMRSQPAHAQLAAKMKDRGSVVEPGSRIEYVVTQHPDPHAKLFERIEDPSYAVEHSDLVPIDPLYYAQNLINPVDQTVEVCFKRKKVVERIVMVHMHFRTLMLELTWYFHPYEFHDSDGTVGTHPLFRRFKPKQKSKQKQKAVLAMKQTAKKSQKPKVGIADLVADLLQK